MGKAVNDLEVKLSFIKAHVTHRNGKLINVKEYYSKRAVTVRHTEENGVHRVSAYSDHPDAQHEYGDFHPGEISYIEHSPQPGGSTHVHMRETRDEFKGQGLQNTLQDALHAKHPHVHSIDKEPSGDAVDFRNSYMKSRPGTNWTTPEGW